MGVMPSPDPDFLRYATLGEEAAFRALVTAHLPMVLAVAGRRLGDHAHLSADVAQAVFTRLARAARGLPPQVTPAAWLHRQTVRLAIDAVRAETRRRLRERASVLLHAPDPPSAPSSWQGLIPHLDEALDRLPVADRTALVLRYFQDQDFESVGAALGSTPEAARKRIARSLEKLRALLGQSGRGAAVSPAVVAALLTQRPPQAAAASLTASISKAASSVGASGGGTAALFTFAMSHPAAVIAGAAAALLAAGLFYQQRETVLRDRMAAAPSMAEERLAAARPSPFRMGIPGTGGIPGEESGPRTLAEIIARLREITAGPGHRLARLRIAALLRRIPPEDYAEFYTAAEALMPGSRWPGVVEQSIQIWQDRDPAALTKALAGSDNGKRQLIMAGNLKGALRLNSLTLERGREGGVTARFPLVSVFKHWLKRDHAEALQWLRSQSDSPLMRVPHHGRETFFDRMQEQAMASAPLNASLTESGVSGANAPWSRLSESWAKGQLDAGVPWTEVLARPWTPEEARILISVKARTHPEEVQSWILTLAPGSDLRFEAALGMVRTYAAEDVNSVRTLAASKRLERAGFALSQADGRSRGEALEAIVTSWLEGWAGDPEEQSALRAWVLASGSGEETTAALVAGARLLAGSEYSLPGASAFASGISDPARRDPLLRGIYLRLQDTAPREAAGWLASASPEIAAVLRSASVPSTPSSQP
ncbi:MAG: sigma-70 family RNA polymerase sigma factor [Verrucomicrobiaceae bacterium]|nr:MAG: sigma-70 family RNA polymerase sigma factor [Verrucomicrobiaceae bacterium]